MQVNHLFLQNVAIGISMSDSLSIKRKLHTTLQQLDKVYDLQNERVGLLQEQQAVELEWKHFCMDNKLDQNRVGRDQISSKRVISLWLGFQACANGEKPKPTNWFSKWKDKIKWWWMKWICRPYTAHKGTASTLLPKPT